MFRTIRNKYKKLQLRWSERGWVKDYFKRKQGPRALIIYVVAPFRVKLPPSHQNLDQVMVIAKELDQLGYQVDVLNFDGPVHQLKGPYDVILDVHPGRHHYPHLEKKGTRKIAYITGSNPDFANREEARRLEEVFQKKGVKLQPRRQAPSFTQEVFDTCNDFFYIGDEYNIHTYDDLRLPKVSYIRNSGYPELYHLSKHKIISREFLFLGSWGQVHKGLDLLLDVFTKHPEWTLHICSRYQEEQDFFQAYHKELTTYSNILGHGFMDIRSQPFHQLLRRCTFMVMPSCSEGISGGVLTAMSGGLIPVVSRISGFSEEEVEIIPELTADSVEQTIASVYSWPDEKIEAYSQKMVDCVQRNYSMENFAESIRNGLNREK